MSRTDALPAAFLRLNNVQALGALNDNLIKLVIVFFLIGHEGEANAGIDRRPRQRRLHRCHFCSSPPWPVPLPTACRKPG